MAVENVQNRSCSYQSFGAFVSQSGTAHKAEITFAPGQTRAIDTAVIAATYAANPAYAALFAGSTPRFRILIGAELPAKVSVLAQSPTLGWPTAPEDRANLVLMLQANGVSVDL